MHLHISHRIQRLLAISNAFLQLSPLLRYRHGCQSPQDHFLRHTANRYTTCGCLLNTTSKRSNLIARELFGSAQELEEAAGQRGEQYEADILNRGISRHHYSSASCKTEAGAAGDDGCVARYRIGSSPVHHLPPGSSGFPCLRRCREAQSFLDLTAH